MLILWVFLSLFNFGWIFAQTTTKVKYSRQFCFFGGATIVIWIKIESKLAVWRLPSFTLYFLCCKCKFKNYFAPWNSTIISTLMFWLSFSSKICHALWSLFKQRMCLMPIFFNHSSSNSEFIMAQPAISFTISQEKFFGASCIPRGGISFFSKTVASNFHCCLFSIRYFDEVNKTWKESLRIFTDALPIFSRLNRKFKLMHKAVFS